MRQDYSRIKITAKVNVHAFATVEKFAGGIVVIPPGADEAGRYYFRGEVGMALDAFLNGSVEFPITNGVLDIYRGWTERRVAQDIAEGWDSGLVFEEPPTVVATPHTESVNTTEPRVPRLNMRKIRELER